MKATNEAWAFVYCSCGYLLRADDRGLHFLSAIGYKLLATAIVAAAESGCTVIVIGECP